MKYLIQDGSVLIKPGQTFQNQSKLLESVCVWIEF